MSSAEAWKGSRDTEHLQRKRREAGKVVCRGKKQKESGGLASFDT